MAVMNILTIDSVSLSTYTTDINTNFTVSAKVTEFSGDVAINYSGDAYSSEVYSE